MRCRGQFFHLAAVDRFDQCIPCREMAIHGTSSNTRLLRDFVQTGIGTLASKGSLRDFKNTLAVSLRIRPRLSGGAVNASSP
jgi:hypothetical protein